jgi:hypothetical protein
VWPEAATAAGAGLPDAVRRGIVGAVRAVPSARDDGRAAMRPRVRNTAIGAAVLAAAFAGAAAYVLLRGRRGPKGRRLAGGGGLVLKFRDAESGVVSLVDPETGVVVGEAVPSDVYPGKWRAAVADPRIGYGFVRVSGAAEEVVDLPQVGTEVFASAEEAARAVARNRVR